jgi:ABC-2 type transport system permease protein
MEASVVILPAIGIFTFGSFVTPLIEKYPILAIVKYLPNLLLTDLANQVETGASLIEVRPNLGSFFCGPLPFTLMYVHVQEKHG